MEPRRRRLLTRLVLIALTVVTGVFLGVWQLRPPGVDTGSPDHPADLSMTANVARFAVTPHPAGSPAIEAVRTGILAEIRAMGLNPVVEEASYTQAEILALWLEELGIATLDELWERSKDAAAEYLDIHDRETYFEYVTGVKAGETLVLRNILVMIDAPGTDRGVMFVAHYDSTEHGPGAGDDMVGVCALLEAMRDQAANPKLKTDLYFLLTDAEEDGLLGARAFAARHPAMKAFLDAVVNFEARGNRGGLLLFQTSGMAYSLVKSVIQSGADPIGMSWLVTVYDMMPNDTDLTVFLGEGYRAINFAVVEGVEAYHQPADSYDNLNRDTAWQYLRTALALVRTAGAGTLESEPTSDAVFFMFLPGRMVLMTGWVSALIGALAGVAGVGAALWDQRKHRLTMLRAIRRGLFVAVTVTALVIFPSGAFLLYIPLIGAAVTGGLRGHRLAHTAAWVVTGLVTLLLWVPVGFAAWVGLIQPMLI